MKPIHYSKLKKGDLIYVESKRRTANLNPSESYLAQVLSTSDEIYKIAYNNGEWNILSKAKEDFFFLIERGYFA